MAVAGAASELAYTPRSVARTRGRKVLSAVYPVLSPQRPTLLRTPTTSWLAATTSTMTLLNLTG